MVNLYQGDCLEEMGKVADHSVDMILPIYHMGQLIMYGINAFR